MTIGSPPSDADDDKKQSTTVSLTKRVLRRLQQVMDENGLPIGERSDLIDFLLDQSLNRIESGDIKLPIEHVAVLKKNR
jgi:hypothetical protein